MTTNRKIILLLSALVVITSCTFGQSEIGTIIEQEGKLLFEDNFERNEPDEIDENIGNGWKTNSARITEDGKKQADLIDSTLMISMSDDAKHGLYVSNKAGFKNGIIQARFTFFNEKGIGFNIVDPDYKGSSFGHICELKVFPKSIVITDGRSGKFNRKFIKQKRNGTLTKEEKETIKSFQHKNAYQTNKNEWHEISILYKGDTMKVYLDDELASEFSSVGIAHPTKADFGFAVWGKVQIDYVRTYSLD